MKGNATLWAKFKSATNPEERSKWLNLWRRSCPPETQTAPAIAAGTDLVEYAKELFPGSMTIDELDRIWQDWIAMLKTKGEDATHFRSQATIWKTAHAAAYAWSKLQAMSEEEWLTTIRG